VKWAVALKCSAALISLAAPGAAFAQQRSFDIASAEAVRSIPEFARQAGLQIVAPGEHLRGVVLPAIKGTFDVRAALKAFLAHTDLEIVSDIGEVIVLRAVTKKAEQSEPPAKAASEPARQASAARLMIPIPGLAAGDEVIVTGSRIIRYGYEAPTPLTVIGPTTLAQTALPNVADTLNTLPIFSGSLTPAQGAGTPSFNNGGISALDLRDLGENRTLILLDGQRTVPVLATGIVDVNNIPQQLVARVDVVTGGSAAVYGSDAVSGVVNFVLDREFTGVKGEVSGGITTYGDDPSHKISLAGGFSFAGDRGHVLLSGEWVNKYGIVNGSGPRAWARSTTNRITNPNYTPTNGEPEYITRNDVFLSQATHGGLITSGPLKGIAFGPGGAPYTFNYGITTPNDLFMAGGDYLSTRTHEAYSLDPAENRQNLFLRLSYNVSDNVNVFFQTSWGASNIYALSFPHYEAGAGPTVLSGNPFIPATVQAQMDALGVTSFRLGTMNYDMPFVSVGTNRVVNRYVVGISGKFDAAGTVWSWNGYAQIGQTRSSFNTYNVEHRTKYAMALDAVRDPNSGAIVCRSSLRQPNNGCIPWNPMGTGVNSNVARNYILGTAHSNQATGQDVYAVFLAGEPFSSWAGPVSLALSAEHRKESAKVVSGPIEQAGLWRSGNHQMLDATNNVMEASVETVVPLAKKTRFADSWDVTAAFRATHYQVSGYVSTWKVGTTYAPIPDLRIRATRSRDIRAPNISELYQEQNFGLGTILDPFTNTTPTVDRRQAGSLTLRPEKADTTDIGIVIQPRFLPGFSVSADYWNIDIKDAITSINASTTVMLCYQGRPEFCGNITRTNGLITHVVQGNYNFATQAVRGFDFEASYGVAADTLVPTWSGDVAVHVNATHYLKNRLDDGLSPPNDTAGTFAGTPDWVLNAALTYTYNHVTVGMTARAFSSGVQDNDFIACTSGCPTSTILNPTFDTLKVAGGLYFDASFAYRFEVEKFDDVQAFLNVRNILNRDPALTPRRGGADFSYIYSRSQGGRWDKLGRVFRAGVRFRM